MEKQWGPTFYYLSSLARQITPMPAKAYPAASYRGASGGNGPLVLFSNLELP
jgi:hypothetical protein